MFRPDRNASPFSVLDMDMWDTNLTAQSEAWRGLASVSGSGFMSKINSSSSSGSGSFRQSDPSLRKWQSLSHLGPNVSPRSFSSLSESTLRSGWAQNSLRQTGMMQWLQDAQERMDSNMDLLRTDPRLSSAHLLDMKSRERHMSEADIFKLKQSLREAESRAKRQEEECAATLKKLQIATEAQKLLQSQTTELKQRLTQTIQNQSELQDQLREANSKISQSYLEKATLSNQVLKLEDTVQELKTKLSAAVDDLVQERADLQEKTNFLELQLEKNIQNAQREPCLDLTETDIEETLFLKQEVAALRQTNEDLGSELVGLKQTLNESQVQLQELTIEKATKAQQITELETKCAELIRKIKAGKQDDMEEMMEQLTQLRASLRSLEFEKQKHQDHCLFLETEVFEKEKQLKLLEEKHRRLDAGRDQHIQELQTMVSHWREKWQKSALVLQCKEAELDKMRKKNKSESEAFLKLELDVCKQELELVKINSQTLLNKEDKDGGDTVQTQDKETMTDSCLLPTSFSQDFQGNESEQLVKKTAGCDDKEEDRTAAQITEPLKVQLEESKQTATQLEQEKTLAVQQLSALKQRSLATDERMSAEDRRGVEMDTELQRRLVNEQIKNMFQEKEESETVSSENGSTQDWAQVSKVTRGALHDRWSWHQGSGLMPVFEEEEPGDEDQDATKMFTLKKEIQDSEAHYCEPQEPTVLGAKPALKGLDAFAEQVSNTCTFVSEMHKTRPLFCPDGLFHVKMVDICSPDEDEVDY